MSHQSTLSRRTFLRGAGGAMLSLPFLDAMRPDSVAAEGPLTTAEPRRLVAMNFGAGLHPEAFFPKQVGKDYELSTFLQKIDSHRNDFTVISGLSHPGVGGAHRSNSSIFTGTPNPSDRPFRSGVSIDNVVAEQIGDHTRFASLRISERRTPISWNHQGVNMPVESNVVRIYQMLFGVDDERKRALALARMRSGRSILDVLEESTQRLNRKLGNVDRAKMDEFLHSVRDVEKRIAKEQSWFDKPKPRVELDPPTSDNGMSTLQRIRLYFDLMYLAIESDSTRCIVYGAPGGGNIEVPGVKITSDYHNLSHHGQDPDKIRQTVAIESAFMDEVNRFLDKLKATREQEDRLLDRTTVLITSNLGNGAGHSTNDLPVLIAGGKFRHGMHLKFDPPNTTPLCNVFVSVLKQLGLTIDSFSTSTGPLAGFDETT